jgi:hypothetical protein
MKFLIRDVFFLLFITMNMECRQRGNLSNSVSTVPKEALYVFSFQFVHQLFGKSCYFIQTILPFSRVSDLSSFHPSGVTSLSARLLSSISAMKY